MRDVSTRRGEFAAVFWGMSPTHKNNRRARGRPPLPAAAKTAAAKLAREDGERLQAELKRLGLSQAEAARRSGIRQGWLNDIANGKRSINREDLRRLGRIGVSAEYLLGLTDHAVSPGQTRPLAALEADLKSEVLRRVFAKDRYEPTIAQALRRAISGAALLDLLERKAREECNAQGAHLRQLALLGRTHALLRKGAKEQASNGTAGLLELASSMFNSTRPSGGLFDFGQGGKAKGGVLDTRPFTGEP